ncbi:hypothetical protein EMPG_09632 [Blastomyces silverae]|uniref:Uncharacterized protein n=1 Tax=Blastomyces silverae TaxID=2060906 RepID=A0A0H1BS55_9EURO|nr:hypothetical protein EMPG_09632 [Blastomyces silverae]
MPAPSRLSFLSLSKSRSTATSPPSQAEAPELHVLPSDSNQSISDTNAPIAASQTPVPSSILLSNLIPTVLILIYAIYIIHRIRRYTLFVGIKRFFRTCVSLPQNAMNIVWKSERGASDGYVHVNTNSNPHHCVEHDGWDELATFYGDNGDEEIELEGQQPHVAGNEGPSENECCQHGYRLIDSLSSGSDASDAASDMPLEDRDDERFDMSKYFDPMTSRLRESVLFAPEMEIGREDEAEFEGRGRKGDITAWIHDSLGRGVARFISWLDD